MEHDGIDVVRVLLRERVGHDAADGEADKDDLLPLLAIDLATPQLLDYLVDILNVRLRLGLEQAVGERAVSVACFHRCQLD